MRALEPAPPSPIAPLAGTPVSLLLVLGAALGGCGLLDAAGWAPRGVLGPMAVACGHGGLLAVALGWAAAQRPGASAGARSVVTIALLLIAAGATAADPRAAAMYLAVPLWLGWLARRGELAPLGLPGPVSLHGVLAGLGLGAGLGGHLLATALGTAGYRLRSDVGVLTAIAYDVGASVPAAELFLRGGLFNRLQRRWAFLPAALFATGVGLVRYLVDPQLPRVPEVLVGAVLYVSLLGLVNAWLLWWSGSLVPALLGASVFFAAYRLVAPA